MVKEDTMVRDALAGKIDLIITKSVSRFARNTVDSLTTVRKLKDNGIEVYFEKENIWTLDAKGELLITIMSSLAQEESRSISENVTWGQRKRMADGKVSFAYSRFLGLDKDKETGKIVVNPEQAETVRLIFHLFLEGMTPHSIAAELTSWGIKTPAGKDVWNQQTVRRMLSNEKYKGDALLQKEFTVDFLQKKMKKNEDEVKAAFVSAYNQLVTERKEMIANAEIIRKTLCVTDALQEKKDKLEEEMSVLVEMTQNIVEENASVAQDQEEYQKRYDSLVERYDTAKARYDDVVAAISAKEAQSERLVNFIKVLKSQDGTISEFDGSLWGSMVEFVTVGRDKEIIG